MLEPARAPERLVFLQHVNQLCCGRGQDSTYKYFEVILVDIAHTAIRKVRFTTLRCLQSHTSGAANDGG